MGIYLGLDGGGTKTAALVVDDAGVELGQGVGGPGNIANNEDDALRRSLRTAVSAALKAADLPETVRFAGVCAGVAGFSAPQRLEAFDALLRGEIDADAHKVVPDYTVAYWGATHGEPGVVVIAGTGAVAYGRNADGQERKEDGLGFLLGDRGSGFNLGVRVLRYTLEKMQSGELDELAMSVLMHTKAQSENEIIQWLYGEFSPPRVASLSPIVGKLAESGDEAARWHVVEMARRLRHSVRQVRHALWLPRDVPVYPLGGLWQLGSFFSVGVRGPKVERRGTVRDRHGERAGRPFRAGRAAQRACLRRCAAGQASRIGKMIVRVSVRKVMILHVAMDRIAIRFCLIALLAARAAVVFAAEIAPAHSASHPLAPAPPTTPAAARPVYYQPPPGPLGLVASGDRWSVYSRGVNRINAAAAVGTETWLATDMGVKVVDRARRLVTHYTRLDGLPDDRVLAVTGAPEASWAIVATKRGEAPLAALCEFRRGTSRWHTLREVPRPVVPLVTQNTGAAAAYSPGAPLENALVAACPEKLCVALSPVRRDERSFASCFDRRLNAWEEIPALPAAMGDRTSLSITWLDVDRDGIWLATTGGLLRYQLREKAWKRYLPERMVYAAAKAGDGSLWLATYIAPPPTVDANPRAATDAMPAGHWIAVHFLPKTATGRDYPVPDAGQRQSAYAVRVPATLAGIVLTDGAVWLSPGARLPYGNPVPFFRLNPQDSGWRSFPVQSPGDVDPIPDAALAQPTLPRSTLQCASYPWRLTDWVCRDAAESATDAAPRSPQIVRESDGSQWSTDGRTLVLTDTRGVTRRRFGLNQVSIPITPQVSAVTVLNGVLYASSNGEVQAFDIGARAWRRVRLPRNNWSNPNDERLIADGDRLWIGTPSLAIQYDPRTQLFAVEATALSGGYRLLGTIGGVAWLRGPDNLLYNPDPQSGEPDSKETAPLPATLAARYEKAQPFGVAGGLVWFRLRDMKEPEKGMFAGYDPAAGSWTGGRPVRSPNSNSQSCLGVGKRVYLPTVEDDASVCCYDGESGQWSAAAPKLPQGRGAQSLSLVSVDDDSIWALDADSRSLMCYHRKAPNWELFELPRGLWLPQSGNEGVRAGDVIYLATSMGVWSFNIATRAWAQLPGFQGRDIFLNGLTSDGASIWSIARPGNGNQAFGVRLDKATRKWSAWGEKEGFPERSYPATIIPDGASAWTLASFACYRLDAATNRWDNASVRLARPEGGQGSGPITQPAGAAPAPYLEIAEIVPDGDSVWLLPRTVVTTANSPVAKPLLVRFDRTSGRYERLAPSPDPGPKVTGISMQVDKDAVWIPTNEGVFRYGKSDRTWRKIEPPVPAGLWGKTVTLSVVQRDKSYRFYGADSAVAWRE